MDVKLAHVDELAKVVMFLRENKYPDVDSPIKAMQMLNGKQSILLRANGNVFGWVCVQKCCGDAGILHICISQRWRKRWATRGLLRQLVRVIFDDMGVRTLLVEGFDRDGMKLAHGLGFIMLTSPVGNGVGFSATREQIERKLRMNG